MTQYFIIGADGREYGPASERDIRLWVRERRVGGRTQVRRGGESVWRPLAEVSELAVILEGDPSEEVRGETVPPPMPGEGEELALEVFRRDPVLNIGEAFARGWDLLVEHWVVMGVATALGGLLLFGVGSIPVVGVAAACCMVFMVLGGVELAMLRLLRGERVDIGVAFVGFSPPLVLPLFLAGLVSSLLVSLGLMLCVVPGVYLAVCWMLYAPLLIADRRLDFWQALECSRRVVTRYWWPSFGLFLLGTLVVLAGLMACGVGVLVSLPLALAAMVVAYEETFGELGGGDAAVESLGGVDDGGGSEQGVKNDPEKAETEEGQERTMATGASEDTSGESVGVKAGGREEVPGAEGEVSAEVPTLLKASKKRVRAAASGRKRANTVVRRSRKKPDGGAGGSAE